MCTAASELLRCRVLFLALRCVVARTCRRVLMAMRSLIFRHAAPRTLWIVHTMAWCAPVSITARQTVFTMRCQVSINTRCNT